MAENEINKDINVNVKPTGFETLSKKFELANDDLLDVAKSAAFADNKVQGLVSGLKELVAAKLLGQLGVMAGLFIGIATAMYTLARNSDIAKKSMDAVANLEFAETQFKPLLKGAQAAKDRIAQLYMFAANTPFKFDEVVAANKVLEVLTRGALTGQKAMDLVGDAAAVAGAGFEEVALWVGRMYDNLQSGRPVGEAMARLQELGLMSGEARNRIEALAEAGGGLATVWPEVEKELKRAQGGMADMSQTVTGLRSTLEDTKEQMSSSFGMPFLEAEKASLNATIDAFKVATPFVENFAKGIASITNPIEQLIYGLGSAAKELTFLAPLAQAAFPAAVGASIAALVSGLATLAFNLFDIIKAFNLFTTSSAAATTATQIMAAAQAEAGIVAKGAALGQGLYNIAVGEGTFASKAGAMAMVIYNVILKGVGMAARWAAAALTALAFNPWTYIITAAVAAFAAIHMVTNAINEMTEAVEALNKSGNEMIEGFNAQYKAVQTMDDKMKLVAKTYADLQKAEEAYRAELDKPMTNAEWWSGDNGNQRIKTAEMNRDQAKRQVTKARNMDESNLGMGEKDLGRERQRREAQEEAKGIVWDARASSGNIDEKMKVNAEQRLDLEKKIASASKESAAQLQTKKDQGEVESVSGDVRNRIDSAQAKLSTTNDPRERSKYEGLILELQRQEVKLEERKAQIARDSESEIMRLGQAAADATKKGDHKKAQDLTLTAEKKRKDFDEQYANENKKLAKEQEQQQLADQKAQIGMSMEVLAIEKQIANLKRDTYENGQKADGLELAALQKQLDFENAKTDAKKDQAAIAQLENNIEGKKADMAEKARQNQRTRADIDSETKLAQLQLQQGRAVQRGDFKGAAKARDAAIKEQDEQFKRNRMEELQKTMDAKSAQAQLDKEMQSRQQERVQTRQGYKESLATETKVMELRNKGQGKAARAIEDAQAFRDKVNEGINAGLSPQEAQAGAKEFMTQKFMQEQPTITADSMRSIGFGGEAAGGDNRMLAATERIEKMQSDGLKYLEAIAKNTEAGESDGPSME